MNKIKLIMFFAFIAEVQISFGEEYLLGTSGTTFGLPDSIYNLSVANPVSASIAGISLLNDIYSNNKRNDLLESILDKLNQIELNLIQVNCDMFSLETAQYKEGFLERVAEYYSYFGKEVSRDKLVNLVYDVGFLRNRLVDHDGLALACGNYLEQHENLSLYFYIVALEIKLKVEESRVTRILSSSVYDSDEFNALLLAAADLESENVSAALNAVVDYISNIEASVINIINLDKQNIIRQMLTIVSSHLKKLDEGYPTYSWQQRANTYFSDIDNSSVHITSDDVEWNGSYIYEYSGDVIEFHVTSDKYYMGSIPSYLDFLYLDYSVTYVYAGQFYILPFSASRIRDQHMYEAYISYLKYFYEPFRAITNSMNDLIDEAYDVYPEMTNAPVYPLALDADTSLDSYSDYRLTDTDLDGLTDLSEIKTHGTTYWLADSDGDGIDDYYEVNTAGLDPNNILDARTDNDSDGFTNLQEYIGLSDPNNSSVTPGTMLAAILVPIVSLILH